MQKEQKNAPTMEAEMRLIQKITAKKKKKKRKSKPKNRDPRLGLCYSEVLIFAQNNESVAARKPSLILCASLNSKNLPLYGIVFFIYTVCYNFCVLFNSWQWVTEF